MISACVASSRSPLVADELPAFRPPCMLAKPSQRRRMPPGSRRPRVLGACRRPGERPYHRPIGKRACGQHVGGLLLIWLGIRWSAWWRWQGGKPGREEPFAQHSSRARAQPSPKARATAVDGTRGSGAGSPWHSARGSVSPIASFASSSERRLFAVRRFGRYAGRALAFQHRTDGSALVVLLRAGIRNAWNITIWRITQSRNGEQFQIIDAPRRAIDDASRARGLNDARCVSPHWHAANCDPASWRASPDAIRRHRLYSTDEGMSPWGR